MYCVWMYNYYAETVNIYATFNTLTIIVLSTNNIHMYNILLDAGCSTNMLNAGKHLKDVYKIKFRNHTV